MTSEELAERLINFAARIGKVVDALPDTRMSDRYKVEEIEAAADAVVWCCDEGPGFTPTRAQDHAFVGNIVEAMRAYASGRLGARPIELNECDRIIAIGSDKMMAAVAAARHNVLAPYLSPRHVALGSINSPMQCMPPDSS